MNSLKGSRRTRGRRCRRSAAGALVLGAVLYGCDSNPLGPEAWAPEPCRVPVGMVSELAPQPIAPAALHSALQHASGPMAAALGSGELTTDLVKAVAQLGKGMGNGLGDTECRVLNLASTALARMPDDPASRPDRDGIRLVLALAARALVAGSVQ